MELPIGTCLAFLTFLSCTLLSGSSPIKIKKNSIDVSKTQSLVKSESILKIDIKDIVPGKEEYKTPIDSTKTAKDENKDKSSKKKRRRRRRKHRSKNSKSRSRGNKRRPSKSSEKVDYIIVNSKNNTTDPIDEQSLQKQKSEINDKKIIIADIVLNNEVKTSRIDADKTNVVDRTLTEPMPPNVLFLKASAESFSKDKKVESNPTVVIPKESEKTEFIDTTLSKVRESTSPVTLNAKSKTIQIDSEEQQDGETITKSVRIPLSTESTITITTETSDPLLTQTKSKPLRTEVTEQPEATYGLKTKKSMNIVSLSTQPTEIETEKTPADLKVTSVQETKSTNTLMSAPNGEYNVKTTLPTNKPSVTTVRKSIYALMTSPLPKEEVSVTNEIVTDNKDTFTVEKSTRSLTTANTQDVVSVKTYKNIDNENTLTVEKTTRSLTTPNTQEEVSVNNNINIDNKDTTALEKLTTSFTTVNTPTTVITSDSLLPTEITETTRERKTTKYINIPELANNVKTTPIVSTIETTDGKVEQITSDFTQPAPPEQVKSTDIKWPLRTTEGTRMEIISNSFTKPATTNQNIFTSSVPLLTNTKETPAGKSDYSVTTSVVPEPKLTTTINQPVVKTNPQKEQGTLSVPMSESTQSALKLPSTIIKQEVEWSDPANIRLKHRKSKPTVWKSERNSGEDTSDYFTPFSSDENTKHSKNSEKEIDTDDSFESKFYSPRKRQSPEYKRTNSIQMTNKIFDYSDGENDFKFDEHGSTEGTFDSTERLRKPYSRKASTGDQKYKRTNGNYMKNKIFDYSDGEQEFKLDEQSSNEGTFGSTERLRKPDSRKASSGDQKYKRTNSKQMKNKIFVYSDDEKEFKLDEQGSTEGTFDSTERLRKPDSRNANSGDQKYKRTNRNYMKNKIFVYSDDDKALRLEEHGSTEGTFDSTERLQKPDSRKASSGDQKYKRTNSNHMKNKILVYSDDEKEFKLDEQGSTEGTFDSAERLRKPDSRKASTGDKKKLPSHNSKGQEKLSLPESLAKTERSLLEDKLDNDDTIYNDEEYKNLDIETFMALLKMLNLEKDSTELKSKDPAHRHTHAYDSEDNQDTIDKADAMYTSDGKGQSSSHISDETGTSRNFYKQTNGEEYGDGDYFDSEYEFYSDDYDYDYSTKPLSNEYPSSEYSEKQRNRKNRIKPLSQNPNPSFFSETENDNDIDDILTEKTSEENSHSELRHKIQQGKLNGQKTFKPLSSAHDIVLDKFGVDSNVDSGEDISAPISDEHSYSIPKIQEETLNKTNKTKPSDSPTRNIISNPDSDKNDDSDGNVDINSNKTPETQTDLIKDRSKDKTLNKIKHERLMPEDHLNSDNKFYADSTDEIVESLPKTETILKENKESNLIPESFPVTFKEENKHMSSNDSPDGLPRSQIYSDSEYEFYSESDISDIIPDNNEMSDFENEGLKNYIGEETRTLFTNDNKFDSVLDDSFEYEFYSDSDDVSVFDNGDDLSKLPKTDISQHKLISASPSSENKLYELADSNEDTDIQLPKSNATTTTTKTTSGEKKTNSDEDNDILLSDDNSKELSNNNEYISSDEEDKTAPDNSTESSGNSEISADNIVSSVKPESESIAKYNVNSDGKNKKSNKASKAESDSSSYEYYYESYEDDSLEKQTLNTIYYDSQDNRKMKKATRQRTPSKQGRIKLYSNSVEDSDSSWDKGIFETEEFELKKGKENHVTSRKFADMSDDDFEYFSDDDDWFEYSDEYEYEYDTGENDKSDPAKKNTKLTKTSHKQQTEGNEINKSLQAGFGNKATLDNNDISSKPK